MTLTISDVDQKAVEAIKQLTFDLKSLGYWVAPRSDLPPGVLAVKVVNGSMVVLAADYITSAIGDECISKISRYLCSGFDGVLIVTPNGDVKNQILIEIANRVSEKLRKNIAVVEMGTQEQERSLGEAKG